MRGVFGTSLKGKCNCLSNHKKNLSPLRCDTSAPSNRFSDSCYSTSPPFWKGTYSRSRVRPVGQVGSGPVVILFSKRLHISPCCHQQMLILSEWKGRPGFHSVFYLAMPSLHTYHSPPSKMLLVGSRFQKNLYKYHANQAASYDQKK